MCNPDPIPLDLEPQFLHLSIGIIIFISGLLLEKMSDLKYPPEFLEHNKCLASVGSSPMSHYKRCRGRAARSAGGGREPGPCTWGTQLLCPCSPRWSPLHPYLCSREEQNNRCKENVAILFLLRENSDIRGKMICFKSNFVFFP